MSFSGLGRRRRRSAQLLSSEGDDDYETLDTRVKVLFPGEVEADVDGWLQLSFFIII